jgi:DNA end-binding protein Ku
MQRQNKLALGRLVLATREHVVAIEPHEKGLALTTLRDPAEVRAPKTAFGEIKDAKLDPDMVKLAESLIVDKTGPLDPALFEDRYQAALRALIAAKAKGRKPALPKGERPPSNVVNLMDALRRSVRQAGAQRPARAAHHTAGRRPGTRGHTRRKAS